MSDENREIVRAIRYASSDILCMMGMLWTLKLARKFRAFSCFGNAWEFVGLIVPAVTLVWICKFRRF